jgi:hypothetical protein
VISGTRGERGERQRLQRGLGRPSKEERRRACGPARWERQQADWAERREGEEKKFFSFFLFDFSNPFSKVFKILLNFGFKTNQYTK